MIHRSAHSGFWQQAGMSGCYHSEAELLHVCFIWSEAVSCVPRAERQRALWGKVWRSEEIKLNLVVIASELDIEVINKSPPNTAGQCIVLI